MSARPRRVVLIGFSGTGKSTVAASLAGRLGWRARDSDAEIVRASGRAIEAIFAEDGEAAFRAIERDILQRLAAEADVVIATGGGAFMDPDTRRMLADGGFVVCLEARIDTITSRTGTSRTGAAAASSAGAGAGGGGRSSPEVRPLLAGPDPLTRIRRLKAARQPFYALADCTIHTDDVDVDTVVDEIAAALERRGERAVASEARLLALVDGPHVPSTSPPDFGPETACTVQTPGGTYPVYVGRGLLERLPDLLRRIGCDRCVFVISDTNVRDRYGGTVLAALRTGGYEAHLNAVEPGERSKSLASLATLYDWLADQRAERDDAILALGGGVVTDLAGTVAATYLRGMPLVHAPTTLLGMVDAAIGGKVAIDLPAGKNLVGAFHQPKAVIADIATLTTLPPRELRAGYAEVIKHAWILDAAMLDALEADVGGLLSLAAGTGAATAARPDRVADLIGRNVGLKAAVVSADERESGLRMILNYGHTIGHAIEAVTEYGHYHHGEAVGVGLVGAAMIAERMGLVDRALVQRHRTINARFGLPVAAPGLDAAALLRAIMHDKKVRGGRVRWILLQGVALPAVREDVPPDLVHEVLSALTRGDS